MKNTNQKLLSLNEEYSQKIKELNEQLEEYKNKNNNNEENDNENTNKNYGFKKLISVTNIGGGGENEENEKNKKTENIRQPSEYDPNNYKRFPTARFGGDFNSNVKTNEENDNNNNYNNNNSIFKFEKDDE